MIKKYTCFLLLTSLMMLHFSVMAQTNTLTGLWKAHDDQGKPTGYIRITENKGIYTGVIEKGLQAEGVENICTACEGPRKNKPLIGMVIIKNVTAKGDTFIGDEILDPFTGKTYRVKLKLKSGGQQMEVRGFVGFSLFGRTQVWERAEHGQ